MNQGLDGERAFIKEIVVEESLVSSQENGRPAAAREAYSIDVSLDGTTLVNTLSTLGGIRAFNTLAQLFYAHSRSLGELYTLYAPVTIRDEPAFDDRGLNLDISRNGIPREDVKRTIEAMGFSKFNKLHLHAIDAQLWPLEIPAIPILAKEGAYREDQVWSVKDLEEVQRHVSRDRYARTHSVHRSFTPGSSDSVQRVVVQIRPRSP